MPAQIKQIITVAIALFSVACLTGCVGPSQLGLSAQQWAKMKPKQQQQAMNNYATVKKQLAQQTTVKPTQQPAKTMYLPQAIQITLLSGQAYFPTQFQKPRPFSPASTQIQHGTCTKLPLSSTDQLKKTELTICYDHQMLRLDPSYYKPSQIWGTLYIDTNPLWQNGITYKNLSSHGFVRLRNASITVKALT